MQIYGARHTQRVAIEGVGIDHHGPVIAMAQKIQNRATTLPLLQRMRGE